MSAGQSSYLDLCNQQAAKWEAYDGLTCPPIESLIKQFLESEEQADSSTQEGLVALVATDLEARYDRNFGEQRSVRPPLLRIEDYLLGIPSDYARSNDLQVALITEEAYWRKKFGDTIVVSEYVARFPKLARSAIEEALQESVGKRGPFLVSHDWERTLDEGGMGVVHLYWSREHERHIALKIAKPGDEDLRRALTNEATMLVELGHKNLISIHRLYGDAINPFYTMDYVEGARHFAFENFDDRARAAFIQLADVLQFLHQRHIFHCDVKPSNVLLSSDSVPSSDSVRDVHVTLLDLGTALRSYAGDKVDLTKPAWRGSLPYMAPERLQESSFSAASDWYSVGVLLFQSLSGQLPFQAKNLEQAIAERKAPPRPSKFRETIPAELDELCHRLLHWDPMQRTTGAELIEALDHRAELRPSTSTKWVGRSDTINRMQDLYDSAFKTQSNRTTLVAVHGESGIGKTTTVEQFLNSVARRSDTLILRGKCYASGIIGEFDGFHALFSGLMEKLFERWGDEPQRLRAYLPPDVSALRELDVCRGIERVLSQAQLNHDPFPDLPKDPLARRDFALAALRDLLRLLAREFRLVLFVDDLQWAGRDAATLIKQVFMGSLAPRSLLVFAYRDESDAGRCLDLVLPELEKSQAYSDVALGPLSNEQSEQLLRSRLGEQIDAQVIRRFRKDAAGNPFRIELIARHCAAQSRFKPSAISELLALQLSELDEVSQTVVELLALCGRPIREQVVQQCAGLGIEAPRVFRQLCAEGLVRWVNQNELDTFHDQVRDIAVKGLQRDRARLETRSLQVAQDLERSDEYQSQYDLLAELYENAARNQIAGQYRKMAAVAAVKSFRFDIAAKHQSKAIALLQPKQQELGIALSKRAAYLGYAGRVFLSGSEYEAAAKFMPPTARTEIQCQVALRYLSGGYLKKGQQALRKVFNDCRLKYPTHRGSFLQILWQLAALKWAKRRPFKEAKDISTRQAQELDALWAGIAGLSLIDPPSAANLRLRYARRAHEFGSSQHAIRSLVAYLGFVNAINGGRTTSESDRLIAEARQLATRYGKQIGNSYSEALCELAVGMSSHLQGNWKQAVAACDKASGLFEKVLDANWELTTAQVFAIWATLYQGDMQSLARRFPAGYQMALSRQDVFAQLNYGTRVQAILRLAQGDADAAISVLDEHATLLRGASFPLQSHNELLGRIQVELSRDAAHVAWDLIRNAWQRYRKTGLKFVQHVFVDFWAWYGLAAAASRSRTSGNQTHQSRRLRRATQSARHRLLRTGAPWGVAQAKMLQAITVAIDADRRTAISLFTQAEEALMAVDLHTYALACQYARNLLLGESTIATEAAFTELGYVDSDLIVRSIIPIDRIIQPRSGSDTRS